ncbi:hypothetical protein I7I50_04009 [Histoplasma capsulatum G186AR]|uniref:Uncharacterized protein n=1 Tax=Ajellomyces capsulatus TaxID=5037 RepID=A0A8H7YQ21_AJECA|nr:hypothetical protein I7I52_04917 [Histoplasma capsulatum]QSS75015.1 hypothetical protein I7I50_04009 [Histoplasma capsulatum G186AR]
MFEHPAVGCFFLETSHFSWCSPLCFHLYKYFIILENRVRICQLHSIHPFSGSACLPFSHRRHIRYVSDNVYQRMLLRHLMEVDFDKGNLGG